LGIEEGRMSICDLKHTFEVLAALGALAAASWWFAAAWVTRGASTYANIDRIQRRQAIYNGIAASCAGIAAILQLVTTAFMPVCRAFS
jgi:hypothetical protein